MGDQYSKPCELLKSLINGVIKINYPKNRYTGEKPWMDRDWLYDQYITQDRRTADIAADYGCKPNTINQWLIKFNIKKKITTRKVTPKHQYELYDYLYQNHIVLHKSMSEIARENNVSADTIRYNLKKNGIEPWSNQNAVKHSEEEIQAMIRFYCDEKKSAYEI